MEQEIEARAIRSRARWIDDASSFFRLFYFLLFSTIFPFSPSIRKKKRSVLGPSFYRKQVAQEEKSHSIS